MLNPFKEINWQPGRAEIVAFGKTLMIGGGILELLAVMVRVFLSASRHVVTVQVVFLAIIVFGLVAYVLPTVSKPIYLLWFFVGACIGTVVSNLLFLMFFYLLFTPIAWLVRFNREDPLMLKPGDRETLWHERKPPSDPARYYRQF